MVNLGQLVLDSIIQNWYKFDMSKTYPELRNEIYNQLMDDTDSRYCGRSVRDVFKSKTINGSPFERNSMLMHILAILVMFEKVTSKQADRVFELIKDLPMPKKTQELVDTVELAIERVKREDARGDLDKKAEDKKE